jgi:lathosterol oxidase
MDGVVRLKAQMVPWPGAGPYATNLFLCALMYLGVNTAWCASQRRWPRRSVLVHQVAASLCAAPWYALLPTGMEWLAARGLTRLHGGALQPGEAVVFLCAVEMLVYWVHRALHESPWLYRHVHRQHHIYKSREEMSPFASMAFMPLDGLAQAAPYALAALVLPCHASLWESMLFATGVWSSSIHDGSTEGWPGVMGARYHTVHHTHFRCNYGQYTIVCDWLFGTLRV